MVSRLLHDIQQDGDVLASFEFLNVVAALLRDDPHDDAGLQAFRDTFRFGERGIHPTIAFLRKISDLVTKFESQLSSELVLTTKKKVYHSALTLRLLISHFHQTVDAKICGAMDPLGFCEFFDVTRSMPDDRFQVS